MQDCSESSISNVKTLRVSRHFWEMRSAKCARDCSGSPISYVNHIIIIIMKVVGKCTRSGRWEFRLSNTLRRKTLYFFGVKWLPWSPKEGLIHSFVHSFYSLTHPLTHSFFLSFRPFSLLFTSFIAFFNFLQFISFQFTSFQVTRNSYKQTVS